MAEFETNYAKMSLDTMWCTSVPKMTRYAVYVVFFSGAVAPQRCMDGVPCGLKNVHCLEHPSLRHDHSFQLMIE